MTPFSLFKRSEPKSPPASMAKPEQPAPKKPVVTLGVDENGRYRGIFKDERIHMAVVGFPGCGKSRFLLSLAIQNVRDGEGLMIIDPHGDLVKIFLSHIPKHRWKDVIYIDPLTARNYGKVVKINFLECHDTKDRDIVARTFMDSLEKIYAKFWGPRLDMILMNAVYALLDAGNTNLSNLYSIIADEQFRGSLLQKVGDEKVRSFWESEFKRMPKDASSAALTKIYRIVQERIVAPVFDCVKSNVDFRKAMDEHKIIVVNLSEGAVTSDVANFLGSLILARVYIAGMSREDMPEEKRVPFYVYVDEAYRFVSLSIRDILQSLRKYRVYMTLASQYLGQYSKEIAASIPHLCDTIICFAVGEDTAKALEEFYKPSLIYLDLVQLPKFTFAASAMIGGKRECQVLRSVDCGWGPVNVEELIKFSLENYAEEVDMSKYTGVPAVGELPHPTNEGFMTPLPWVILTMLYDLCEEKLGVGMASQGSFPYMDRDGLVERLHSEFGVSEVEVERALRELSSRQYIATKSYNYDYEVIPVSANPHFHPTPKECSECKQPTSYPFILSGGRVMCRHCLERALYNGSVNATSVVDPQINPTEVRIERHTRRRATKYSYAITPYARKRFFEQAPTGARGGGTIHARAIGAMVRDLRKDYCYCEVDVGEETPRKTADGKEEYEVKKLPDITVCPVAVGEEGRLNPRHWGTGRMFTVEVEVDPIRHRQRVINNLRKNREWGMPVLFVTTDLKWANDLRDILVEQGEKVVSDSTGLYGGQYDPKSVSVHYIDIDDEKGIIRTRIQLASETEIPKTVEAEKVAQQPSEKAPEKPAEKPVEEKPQAGEKAEKTAEEKPAVEGVAKAPVTKLPIELQLEDLRQLCSIFRDKWLPRRRLEGGVQILYFERQEMGKTVRVRVGPYDQFEKIFGLVEQNVPLITEEEKSLKTEAVVTPPTESSTAKMPPAEEKEFPREAPTEHGGKPAEEVAEAPTQPSVEAPQEHVGEELIDRQIWRTLPPEERLKLASKLQYKLVLRKRKGEKFEVYAQKWAPGKGKPDKPFVGIWNEKLEKLAKELKIEVSGQTLETD